MIPNAWECWYVVLRRVRDTTSSGRVVKARLSERMARDMARDLNARLPDWQAWAIKAEA
jgi:hypothetical protein